MYSSQKKSSRVALIIYLCYFLYQQCTSCDQIYSIYYKDYDFWLKIFFTFYIWILCEQKVAGERDLHIRSFQGRISRNRPKKEIRTLGSRNDSLAFISYKTINI